VPGVELVTRFGSKAADEEGSDNMLGLKSPAVDAILNALVHAQTKDDLVDTARALDRVLINGYYIVPHWYSTTHRVAYKRTLRYPSTLPLYYSAEDWIVSTWWLAPDMTAQATR
jgi:microcin C transport system substrate-binding protein